MYYLGDNLIHLGRRAWQTLFGGVGGGGRTVGRAALGAAVPTFDSRQSRPRSSGEDSDGRSAYRRQVVYLISLIYYFLLKQKRYLLK